MAEGYDPNVFVDGPLAAALRDGSLLYVEEINRVPEETLNVLITVMSEGELHVPRLGRLAASPGFRLVAAMNPFDAIGTARISGAVYDRVCRLRRRLPVGERRERHRRGGRRAPTTSIRPGSTRSSSSCASPARHPDLRVGSSVRGAIDMCAVAASLAVVRGASAATRDVSLDAALVALSGRIRLREGTTRTADDIVRELWGSVFATVHDGAGEPGKAGAPTGATTSP